MAFGLFLRVLLVSVVLVWPYPPNGPALAQSSNLPLNQQIMFGGVTKNAAQKAADKKLIEHVVRAGRTRRQGAEHASKRGFEYLRKGDLPTAIKRFNQAWLLNPDYGGTYWGFAVILIDRDRDPVAAEEMFKRAEKLLPNDEDLQVDMGRFYGKTNRHEAAAARFKNALQLNPNARDAHAGLTTYYAQIQNFRQALFHAQISVDRKEFHPPAIIPFLRCVVELEDNGQNLNDENNARCAAHLK